MKLLTTVFVLFLICSNSAQAQEAMGAPMVTSIQNIALKLDKATGKISIYNTQHNVEITKLYELSQLELEIFDSNGEYAGSLDLKDFLIPKNEVDKSEKVKIAKFRFKNTATGEELSLSNVDFVK